MNGYLFSAGVRQTRSVPDRGVQTWDSCIMALVYAVSAEQAQHAFESWLGAGEPVEIKRMVAVQLVEQLLTESGAKAIDWESLVKRTLDVESAMAVDGSRQGLWVDVNQLLPVGGSKGDLEFLRRKIPEEVASELNWDPGKQCLFLVTALSPPPPPPDPEAQFEEQSSDSTDADEPDSDDLDEFVAALPDMREKVAGAVVEARNALVAGYLWREFTAGTAVATNEIHVSQCCTIFSAEAPADETR